MKEFIVKCQVSLSPGAETILIYSEDKKYLEMIEDPSRVKEILSRLGGSPKAYFNAQLNETGIKLLEEVKKQSW